jgi:hypothetical protein
MLRLNHPTFIHLHSMGVKSILLNNLKNIKVNASIVNSFSIINTNRLMKAKVKNIFRTANLILAKQQYHVRIKASPFSN